MGDKERVLSQAESSPGGILNLTAEGSEVYQHLLMVIDFCNNLTLLLETMRECKVPLWSVGNISQISGCE